MVGFEGIGEYVIGDNIVLNVGLWNYCWWGCEFCELRLEILWNVLKGKGWWLVERWYIL